jgi:hypothetical protein
MGDFGVLPLGAARMLKLPAPLACYWPGRSEIEENNGDPGYSIFTSLVTFLQQATLLRMLSFPRRRESSVFAIRC